MERKILMSTSEEYFDSFEKDIVDMIIKNSDEDVTEDQIIVDGVEVDFKNNLHEIRYRLDSE